MVQAIAAFMETCYMARRNAISASALERFRGCVDRFYKLRDIFITAGVRTSISLPRQHALFHYYLSIQLFGSPNGLCSSITESKHIKAVKEPWRRSNRYKALNQMLRTILRLEKMATLRRIFTNRGMLTGTTASYMARTARLAQEEDSESEVVPALSDTEGDDGHGQDEGDSDEGDDGGPIDGTPLNSLSDVKLAARIRM
jgi:hypothetical protein